MANNILLTGAAGYIGGTILTDLLARHDGPVKVAKLFAAVRTHEQVELLSKLEGVSVAQLNLLEKDDVKDFVQRNEIDFVVNLAPSFDQVVVSNLLDALGTRRQQGASNLHFINSSVTAAFAEENGWPFGEISDAGPVLAKAKELGDQHPVRVTDLLVAEKGKELGVKTFTIVVPIVYGTGTGEGRKVSVSIPSYIRVSIKNQVVRKFEKEGHPVVAHVTDLSALYLLLIEKILQRETIPSDEAGIYFGAAFKTSQWKILSAISKSLHSRGLVKQLEPQVWSSYDTAADELGWPRAYIRGMGTSSPQLIPTNSYKLGWKPQWDERRFMESIDIEVQAALDLDAGATALYDLYSGASVLRDDLTRAVLAAKGMEEKRAVLRRAKYENKLFYACIGPKQRKKRSTYLH